MKTQQIISIDFRPKPIYNVVNISGNVTGKCTGNITGLIIPL